MALAAALIGAAAVAPAEVTLRLATWDGDETLRYLRPVVREFEKRNPGVKVRVENFDYVLYHQKMLVQYAANAAPDLAVMDPQNAFRLARRDALLPLDLFLSGDPSVKLADYYPSIVEAFTVGGKLYSLPREISPTGIVFYNKRAFDEAGIPYPDGSWTWDFKPRPHLREKDFLWVMERLTKRDADGKTRRWGFATNWAFILPNVLVRNCGAAYMDDEANPTRFRWDDPKVVACYQLASDLWFKYGWVPTRAEISTVQQSSGTQLFAQGKVAMFLNGVWDVPRIREFLKPGTPEFFEWDVAPFPRFAHGPFISTTGGSGLCVFKTTRHPREAWALLKFVAGEPGMRAMAAAGLQPAIRRLAQGPPWLPGTDAPIELRYPPSLHIMDRLADHVVFGERSDAVRPAMDLAGAEVDRLITGASRDAKSVLAEAQRVATERYARDRRAALYPPFPWRTGLLVGGLLVAVLLAVLYWPERSPPRSRLARRENAAAYRFLSPWLIGVSVFTIGPMILSLLMSFAEWDIIQPARWRGVGNYVEAFGADELFWKSVRVTALYTALAVPLGVAGSLTLALLLNQRVRGIPVFRTLYYIPSIASAVAAALIWRRILNPESGLLNAAIYGPVGSFIGIPRLLDPLSPTPGEAINWLGNEGTALYALVLMSLWGIGGGMVVLLAGLQGIPQVYYEAATLDGAGAWRRFRAVTLPHLSPMVLFCLITGVIGSFQAFTNAYVMTSGGPSNATLFYMLSLYQTAFEDLRMGYASALAWILFAALFVLTLLQVVFGKRWVYYEGEKEG